VHSERKTSTSEDSMERVNIQQPLLVDEMNVHNSTSQEPFRAKGSVPQRNEVPTGSTNQSPVCRSSSVRLSSLHEDERKCGEERKDAVDHEEEATQHRQKVMQTAEELEGDEIGDKQVSLAAVPSALRRDNSTDDEVQGDKVSQLPVAFRTKKCGKHRHHKTSREGDKITKTCGKRCRKHGKEKTEDISVESHVASDVDKSDRSDIEMVREGDTTSVHSEYSLDVSLCKTREQGVESLTGSTTSASYEGLKIVVSLSESTDEKRRLATSPEKAGIFPRKVSPQKMKRSDIVSRNICKQKHMPHDGDSKSVKEKATAMRENEPEGHSKREPEAMEIDVIVQKGESKRRKDRTKKWNFPLDKDLSEASTAYKSPPDQFVPSSDIKDLEKLLETVNKYQERRHDACGIDPWLAIYISQLLVMSRRSIENLDVSTSDTSAPDVETSRAEEIDRNIHHEVTVGSTKRKETTQKQTHKNLKSGINDVEELTNTMKEEMRCMTDDVRMPHLKHETVSHTRQAVCVTSVSQVAGAHSYNEFRHSGTEIQSTSTPGMLPTSHQIVSRDLHDKMSELEGAGREDASVQEQRPSSCRCSDILCEFNVKTPPFPSFISNMSLDEYKVFKFPEIFSNYSERCSERISNLTKKIEQIRGEKRKLIERSGSSSSSSSSGSSARSSGFDSTKYLNQPESTVMTHLSNKDEGHNSTEVTNRKAGAPTSVLNADSRQEVSQNEECPEGTVSIKPGERSETRAQQQQRSHGPHVRPPPCLWRHKLQRSVP
jgi:hypothetical protein